MTFVTCRVKGCPFSGTGDDGLCTRHREDAREAVGESRTSWPKYVCDQTITDENGAEVSRGGLAMRYIAETVPRPQPVLSEWEIQQSVLEIEQEKEQRRLDEIWRQKGSPAEENTYSKRGAVFRLPKKRRRRP